MGFQSVTGSFDPAEPVVLGDGQPGPDLNGDNRPGDNLYTCSSCAEPDGRHREVALPPRRTTLTIGTPTRFPSCSTRRSTASPQTRRHGKSNGFYYVPIARRVSS